MTNPSANYYPQEASGADGVDVPLRVDSDVSYATDGPVETPSTTDVAKSEAGDVKNTAVDAGKDVAATAKDEATDVAGEAKEQAKGLFDSVTGEVKSQAATQQRNIASSIHSLSKELGGMASGSSESGPLTDLAHQGAAKGGEVAHWLQNREPVDVLDAVKDFGRRRPVAFLALCGLAGVLAGRLTRGAVAANTSVDSPSSHQGDRAGDQSELATSSASLVDDPAADLNDPYAEGGYTAARAYTAPSTYAGPGDQLGGAR